MINFFRRSKDSTIVIICFCNNFYIPVSQLIVFWGDHGQSWTISTRRAILDVSFLFHRRVASAISTLQIVIFIMGEDFLHSLLLISHRSIKFQPRHGNIRTGCLQSTVHVNFLCCSRGNSIETLHWMFADWERSSFYTIPFCKSILWQNFDKNLIRHSFWQFPSIGDWRKWR